MVQQQGLPAQAAGAPVHRAVVTPEAAGDLPVRRPGHQTPCNRTAQLGTLQIVREGEALLREAAPPEAAAEAGHGPTVTSPPVGTMRRAAERSETSLMLGARGPRTEGRDELLGRDQLHDGGWLHASPLSRFRPDHRSCLYP